MHPVAKCMKQHQTGQKQQNETGYIDHWEKNGAESKCSKSFTGVNNCKIWNELLWYYYKWKPIAVAARSKIAV